MDTIRPVDVQAGLWSIQSQTWSTQGFLSSIGYVHMADCNSLLHLIDIYLAAWSEHRWVSQCLMAPTTVFEDLVR